MVIRYYIKKKKKKQPSCYWGMQLDRLKINHKTRRAFISPIPLLLQSLKTKSKFIQTSSLPHVRTKYTNNRYSLLNSAQQCTKYWKHFANVNSWFCILVHNAAKQLHDYCNFMFVSSGVQNLNNLFKNIKKVQNPGTPFQFSKDFKYFPIQ